MSLEPKAWQVWNPDCLSRVTVLHKLCAFQNDEDRDDDPVEPAFTAQRYSGRHCFAIDREEISCQEDHLWFNTEWHLSLDPILQALIALDLRPSEYRVFYDTVLQLQRQPWKGYCISREVGRRFAQVYPRAALNSELHFERSLYLQAG